MKEGKGMKKKKDGGRVFGEIGGGSPIFIDKEGGRACLVKQK